MDFLLRIVLTVTLVSMLMLGFLLFKKSAEERQNKSLKIANKKLTMMDAHKNEFLSFATHQLRSPLTSIKWGLSSLKENYSKDMINKLLITTDDLVSTVNDLLDISKLEQGGMVMKNEEFDLYDFIGRIVEEFRITAEKKGLKISFEGDNSACFVVGDQNKIRQVFVNLIDNAIKYTDSGSVKVIFKRNDKTAKIDILDTGPGISKDELNELFDKFLRGKAGKASLGGSGLGLYLAKQIVEAHKGSLEAFSEGLGRGSTFTVIIPIKSSSN